MGQESALGDLKWKQGLCGQVLEINCGGDSVQALVVSTCNLGSDSCGVDMIAKTWNKATGTAPPGEVECTVALTDTNPLSASGPVCYHRPNSDIGNHYSTTVGVLNTSGKITSSASIAGISGQRGNDAWFQFDSAGQDLFGDDATVTFTYEDGSTQEFTLGDCKEGGQTQIFS